MGICVWDAHVHVRTRGGPPNRYDAAESVCILCVGGVCAPRETSGLGPRSGWCNEITPSI